MLIKQDFFYLFFLNCAKNIFFCVMVFFEVSNAMVQEKRLNTTVHKIRGTATKNNVSGH